VFASGLETLAAVPPLNNTQCTLWRRGEGGWILAMSDPSGRTREPCPLAVFPDRDRVFMSSNPTTVPVVQAGGGPAVPVVLELPLAEQRHTPTVTQPFWRSDSAQPAFTEHSYRSFSADGERGELVLFQNVGHTHAEWVFRDSTGRWSARGQLEWPWGGEYAQPKPIRVCYPNVALRHRAVHFVGVSDVIEPNEQWRKFKRELTGKDWDYDFRRLFYTWSPDITRGQFKGWVEIASRERTAGRIMPGDLWLAPDGAAHIVWSETAIDTRLREQFFPAERQRHEMNYAVVRDGGVVLRKTLLATAEGNGPVPHLPRFQVTPENRLFVFFYVNGSDEGGKPLSENRLLEIRRDGSISAMVRVPLTQPLNNYMTATVRAGSRPSRMLDLLGTAAGNSNAIRYARVRID
jgi:hypothetical protein